MRTRNNTRRVRLPALRANRRTDAVGPVLEEEEHFPSSEFVAMEAADALPSLIEHLRECGSRTLH